MAVPRKELRYSRPCAMPGCGQRVKQDHFCERCHERWGEELGESWAELLRLMSDEQAKLKRRIVTRERPLEPTFGLRPRRASRY